jgi:hypothetical protein
MVRGLAAPPEGGLMVIPLLPPKFRELLPVNVPPPEYVPLTKPHHSQVQLLAEEMVKELAPPNKTGVELVPVTFVNVVIVCVLLAAG